MNNTFKVILFAALFFGILCLGVFGLSKLKVDDFHKAAVIFVVDSSASNQKDLPAQKMLIRQLCSMLDPEDHIKILRVSEDSYLIYEGSPQSSAEVRKSMEKFTQYDAKEYGTAYGLSLKKAFNHALNMQKDGYVPAVVVIGDLENEGDVNKQINWDTLPSDVSDVKNQADNFVMMFLFAAPDKLDLVKEKLSPVLGENNLIIGSETTSSKSLRRFLNAIGR
ncbi:VWA domain-containing protein [bacterium]|nr:VWA domain-containing protein [bacterium]